MYGTVEKANVYFAARLHADVWTSAVAADKPKALLAATKIIDALNFKGYKSTVYAVLLANSNATHDEVRVAEATQALEFPRDADTVVPVAIEEATYEIAYALLDGRDPEMDLEALAVTSQRYAAVGTSYDRSYGPQAHILNGVPSMVAWRILLPYLRPANEIKLSRVS
jgi:hypothetical protein